MQAVEQLDDGTRSADTRPAGFEPAVTQVADTPTSLGAMLWGSALGLPSGLLLLGLVGTVFDDVVRSGWGSLVLVAAWLFSGWYIARNTSRVLVVLRRAFGLGATEWLLLALWARETPVALAGSRAAAGAARSVDDLVAALSGTTATVMLWVCVIGFALCWWATRPTTATSPVPDAG